MPSLALVVDVDAWIADPQVRTAGWIALTWFATGLLMRLNGRFFDRVDQRLTQYNIPERRLSKLDVLADVVLVLLAGLLTLVRLGVDDAIWGAIALTSVVGVVVGLAAQRIGQNLLAGMVILFERPFLVGDTIEVDDRTGTVVKVTLYATVLVTPSGLQLRLPNQQVLDGSVTNFSARPERRVTVEIDVEVAGDRVDEVRRVIRQAVEQEAHLIEEEDIVIFAKASLDEGVQLEVRYWVERDHYGTHCLPTATGRILEALETAGWPTARPTQKVYLEDASGDAEPADR